MKITMASLALGFLVYVVVMLASISLRVNEIAEALAVQ